MKKLLAVALLTTLTSGCTTYYREASASARHAIIEPRDGVSTALIPLFTPKRAYIYGINGLPVSTRWKSVQSPRRIAPGTNSVIVKAAGLDSFTAHAEVDFTALPGEHYYIDHKEAEGMDVVFTVEERGSGITVGETIAKKYRKPVKIPVYIYY